MSEWVKKTIRVHCMFFCNTVQCNMITVFLIESFLCININSNIQLNANEIYDPQKVHLIFTK